MRDLWVKILLSDRKRKYRSMLNLATNGHEILILQICQHSFLISGNRFCRTFKDDLLTATQWSYQNKIFLLLVLICLIFCCYSKDWHTFILTRTETFCLSLVIENLLSGFNLKTSNKQVPSYSIITRQECKWNLTWWIDLYFPFKIPNSQKHKNKRISFPLY